MTFDVDLDVKESLGGVLDGHRAEAKRQPEADRSFGNRDAPDEDVWCHGHQSSGTWEKCPRMVCVNPTKIGFAITSSERGRASGTS